MRRYLSIAQYAQLSGLHPQTIYARIKDGLIDAYDISRPGSKRKTWRIPDDKTAAY